VNLFITDMNNIELSSDSDISNEVYNINNIKNRSLFNIVLVLIVVTKGILIIVAMKIILLIIEILVIVKIIVY